MKLNKHWSLLFCLVCFCIVALAASIAGAQTIAEPSFLKYKVMGVVYAPPGSASSVTYGNTNLVGSTDTFSTMSSSTNTVNISVSVGGGMPLISQTTLTYNFSDGWTEEAQGTSSVSVQTTTGNSVSTMGPISSSLGVDHDNDIVYIWLNPVATGTTTITGTTNTTTTLNWAGLASNSCDRNDPADTLALVQSLNGCDPNQYPYPDIIGIPVWCLKNPYFPAEGCAQWLPYTSRSWDTSIWSDDPKTGLPTGPGLTMRDYADILQADPFVTLNGNDINVCHTIYGANLDPNVPESVYSLPLTPLAVSSYTQTAGVAGARLNYADPFDPTPVNLTTPGSQATGAAAIGSGLWPLYCGNNNGTVALTNRFMPYGTVEYPVPGPNGLPSTYAGQFQYSKNSTSTNVATDTHTVSQGLSITTSGGFGLPGNCIFCGSASAGWSGSTTTQQQSSTANNTGTTAYANYSITGPQLSDNYNGPATYNVYTDNVYGTYAFYSDLAPQISPAGLGNIGIAISPVAFPSTSTTLYSCTPTGIGTGPIPSTVPTTSQPCVYIAGPTYTSTLGVQVPNTSSAYTVILTNYSQYPMTMPGPAVTFSNPDFQINPDGYDICSNQVLPAYNSTNISASQCSLNIVFTPLSTTHLVTGQTQAVFANIIAAGTVNVTSTNGNAYQNILESNYAIIEGLIGAPGNNQIGGTLLDAGQSFYQFPLSVGVPLQTTYTFTNYNSTPVYFTNTTMGTEVTLSDSQNFKIVADTCYGRTAPPTPVTATSAVAAIGGTCTITLQYLPPATEFIQGYLVSGGNFNGTDPNPLPSNIYPIQTTTIAISGSVGSSTASVTTLALQAGAQGQIKSNILLSPSSSNSTYGSMYNYLIWPIPVGSTTVNGAANVTNSTPYTVNGLQFTPMTGTFVDGTFQISSTGYSNPCTSSTTLAPGGSCILYYTFNITRCGPAPAWGTAYISASGTYPNNGGYPVPGAATLFAVSVPAGTNNSCQNSNLKRVIISGTEKSTTTTIPTSHATASLTLKPAHITATSKGIVSVTVGGFKVATPYVAGAAVATVVRALAGSLNFNSWSPVTAKYSGDVITLTSKKTGSIANIALVTTGDVNFALQASGSALTGGAKPTTTTKYDTGMVSYTTNGVTASAIWGSTSTAQSLAVALATSINKVAGAYWRAIASGDVITLTGVSQPVVVHGAIVPTGQVKAAVADAAGFSPASFSVTTN